MICKQCGKDAPVSLADGRCWDCVGALEIEYRLIPEGQQIKIDEAKQRRFEMVKAVASGYLSALNELKDSPDSLVVRSIISIADAMLKELDKEQDGK